MPQVLERFLQELEAKFEVKVNEPRYFVGLEIERNRQKKMVKIHQASYIEKLVDKFKLTDAKISNVPLNPTIKYSSDMCPKSKEKELEMASNPYNQLLGSLQFVVNLTRPEIAYAVNLLSRFKVNSRKQHWEGTKQIVRYLKGTIGQGLSYSGSTEELSNLKAYTQTLTGQGTRTIASQTSGYVMMMCGGPISWASRKQECNALSSLESEYIAAAAAAEVQEAKWLRRLLETLNNRECNVELLVDNQGAIQSIHSTEFHRRTKHIHNK